MVCRSMAGWKRRSAWRSIAGDLSINRTPRMDGLHPYYHHNQSQPWKTKGKKALLVKHDDGEVIDRRSYDSRSTEGDVGQDLKRGFGGGFRGDILGFLVDRPSHSRLLPAFDAPLVFSYPTMAIRLLFPACF